MRSLKVFYIPDAVGVETVGLGSVREIFPDLCAKQLLLKSLRDPFLSRTLTLTLCSMRNTQKADVLHLRH
jgi:hypothetical protein